MIDFTQSDEQTLIVDVLSSYLREHLPVTGIGRDAPPASEVSAQTWQGLADLGLFGVGLAATDGGAGYGLAEEVLAFRECGRFLVSPSVLATTLAAKALARQGSSPDLARLLAGNARAALGVPIRGADAGPTGWREAYRIDGTNANFLVLWSLEGLALYSSDQLTGSAPCRSLDPRIVQDRVNLAGVTPHVWIGAESTLHLEAEVLVCALLSGIAEAARDDAVDYAKLRQQFGRPIGGFQAIKHKCADTALRAEAAWSQTILAALTLQEGYPDAEFQVYAAKLVAVDAAQKNAAENIQVHGGIGFTAEHHAHLYMKRAHLLEFCGSPVRIAMRTMVTIADPARAA
jgi:alkylation response protein AidB-like acyl-CoA dehydrogenase